MVELSARSSDCLSSILCYYVNSTNRLQIVHIPELMNRYLKRVVFPGERLMFEALPEAHLEIYTEADTMTTPSERISCLDLRVSEVDRVISNTLYDVDEGDL